MNATTMCVLLFQKQFPKLLAFFIGVGWFVGGPNVYADPPLSVNRIEEDWELVVGTPDPNSSGPQITCSIAPVADDDSLYAAFELNHRSLPAFDRGGMQLQTWSSALNLDSNPFPHEHIMSTLGETVTWTMSMSLNGENVTFEVSNGNSTTWGNFGGQGYLRSSQLADLENLNNYSDEDSVINSGVGFAGNRVQSLVLKRVRYFISDGQVVVDEVPRVVHQID